MIKQSSMKQMFDAAMTINSFFLIAAWGLAISTLKDRISFWWTGCFWIVLFGFAYFQRNMHSSRFNRAWIFYLALFLVNLSGPLSFLDVTIQYIAKGTEHPLFFLTFAWLVLCLGMIWQFISIKRQLKRNLSKDRMAGKLDLENGFWDLTKPFSLDEKMPFWLQIGRIFSPFVVALTFLINRGFGKSANDYFSIALFVLTAAIFFLGYARHISISSQLLHWEKEFNKEIWIKDDVSEQ